MPINRIQIRPYNLKELANIYQVSDKTFKRWLGHFNSELGKKYGNYYTIPQVKIIFEKLGLPGYLEDEEFV
jgi:transcription initiation factor TFIIIB Brf1 subunit/transcription initiation factor TFIIB